MDPVTAAGLFGSIVTIIQAGIQVTKEARDIYDSGSGSTQRNAILDDRATLLESACKELRTSIGQKPGALGLSDADEELRGIAWKCIETSARLRDLLNRIKAGAGTRKRDALIKAFKTKWKQSEIDQLTKEFEGYQNLLDTRLLMNLHQESQTRKMQVERAAFVTPDGLIDALKESLSFPEMGAREEQIEKAHPDTFKWIYDKCMDFNDHWDCFGCWLMGNEGIYWVNGKAGSGKTTFMNYVVHESQTSKRLERWAGHENIVLASFYFWNSGTVLERSIEGLLRALLWQILQECPQTMSIMFPTLRPKELAALQNENARTKYWTESRLMRALNRLISATTIDQCLCLFIDGMDEFEGRESTLTDLVKHLSSAPHIKVCVSSRPVREFEDAFSAAKSMRLERLTAGDIEDYVKATLRQSTHGAVLVVEEKESFESLVKDVAEKSAGVFLWVRLVVARLRSALDKGARVHGLEKNLSDLPGDLDDLFTRMIGNLEVDHQDEASRIFRLFFAAPDDTDARYEPGLSILDLLFSEEVNILGAQFSSVGRTDWQSLENRVHAFERHVELICCGFIEFINDREKEKKEKDWQNGLSLNAPALLWKIPRLLHRSVREFLQLQTVLPTFDCQPKPYDYERLLAARLMTVKTLLEPSLARSTINGIADLALSIARHVEEKIHISNVMLVDEVGRSCMACAREAGFKSWYCSRNPVIETIISSINYRGLDDACENIVHENFDVDSELDFVAYAAAFKLFLYVKARVLKSPSLCKRSDKLPILHAILCVDWMGMGNTFAKPAFQDLLQVVLTQGADPNLQYKSRSAWRLRLDLQGAVLSAAPGLVKIPRDFFIFLEFGADPNVCFDYTSTLGISVVICRRVQETDNESDLYVLLRETITAFNSMPKKKRMLEETQQELLSGLAMLFMDILPLNPSAFNKHAPPNLDKHVPSIFDKDVFSVVTEHFQQSGTFDSRADTRNISDTMSSSGVRTLENTDSLDDEGKIEDVMENLDTEVIGDAFAVKPMWRVNLLFWASNALIKTSDAAELCKRLVDAGATWEEPSIVRICIMGEWSKAMRPGAFKVCTAEENKVLTAAWKEHFPNYAIALLPTLLNGILSLLQKGHIFRDGSFRGDELLQLGNMLIQNCSTKDLQPKVPQASDFFRMVEQLRAIDIITDEGLLRAGRLWRAGAILIQEGALQPETWFQAGLVSWKHAREAPQQDPIGIWTNHEDESIDVEKMARVLTSFQNNGFVDDDFELTEESGMVEDDGILFGKEEAIFMDQLLLNNGLTMDFKSVFDKLWENSS